MPWDVLRVGRFKSWAFSDGTFLEWDVSRAGPFVCAPKKWLKIHKISFLSFTLFWYHYIIEACLHFIPHMFILLCYNKNVIIAEDSDYFKLQIKQ
jgi:hypothetical protein